MDRIRAYVLRKFASSASLEVLRSPTYVEQVQEVIDRAAPIIKEKLKEIGRPRGKRSKSVDLAWNGESLYRHVLEERRYDEESKRGKSGLERKADSMKTEEMEGSFRRDETNLNTEREEKRSRRRSAGSGKRSRRRESGDFGVVDQVDDNSKYSSKLEHEFSATRDTLEARLTATQNILEGISKSTSELGGARKSDLVGSDPSESEISDHVVSLPVVRPPSSRNSKSATKNGSDSLTLPPISPEAPKSTKKKDELSLPVLPTAINNGNHSARKQQEQDISKDAEETSTMHDITSDIEDIAVLPDGHENAKQDPDSDRQDLTSDKLKLINEEERERNEDVDRIFRNNAPAKLDEKRGSLEEFEELEEEGKSEEIFRDSLNVTPEVANVLPLRPDSLESDEHEVKQDDNMDLTRENTFDRLKDKLIEIEMAERSIEKALACQQVATCDIGEMTSQAEKLMTDRKINETREPTNDAEETVSEIRKSIDMEKIPVNKDDEKSKKSNDDEKRKSTNNIKEITETETSNETKDLNVEERLANEKINKTENIESEIKESTNQTENLTNKVETSENGLKKLKNENKAEKLKNNAQVSKNEVEKSDKTKITVKTTENKIKVQDEKPMDKTKKSINENLSNGVEELAVKIHLKNLQSTNPKSYDGNSQITEVIETDSDNTTTSKEKDENVANNFSKSTTSENVTIKSKNSLTSDLPNENGKTQRERKKREVNKLPVTTPLSLEVPYSYVLSEGSPCEIPDSVTTVIIPDRPCSFSATLEDEHYQLELTNQKGESVTRLDMAEEISKDEKQEKDGYDMEIFGEYIQPEIALPVDTDLKRNMKGIKPSQDVVIIHQDLDRIKEEGEEEDEKENDNKEEVKDHQEIKNDKETINDEETRKVTMLEDIVEHEENEEIDAKIIESKAEKISPSEALECQSLPDTRDLTIDTGSTSEERDVAVESKNTLENSSEESGSTQDTHTPTTSSDVKESIESPSRPVVPELNLDSLQDNTVSSFKITASGTEKEDNGSRRESDATTSLVEPLTSDERFMNRLSTADHEEEIVTDELRDLQSEVPEADQLYHAEHAEYEWLGKDPLSTEINLEDEVKSQGESIDLKILSEVAVQADSLLQEKAEAEELGSEEEIARELIGLLDKDMQLCGEELDSKKEYKDSGESEKSSIDVDDKSNRALSASLHSSVEQEKKEHEDSLNKIDKVERTEMTSKLLDNIANISQDDQDKNSEIIDKETRNISLEMEKEARIENLQIAPLAEFEQDELFEENGRSETVEKIIIKSKSDTINADVQEKLEDKQTSVEEIPKVQSSDGKIEEQNVKQEENKQEELQKEKSEQEKSEAYEKCKQDKLDVHESSNSKIEEQNKKQKENEQEELQKEKSEQEKSETDEECKQDKLDVQESSDGKIEEQNKKQKENKQEELQKKTSEQEKSETYEECKQDKLDVQKSSDGKIEELNVKQVENEQEESQKEKSEQEKSETIEECKQDKLDVQESSDGKIEELNVKQEENEQEELQKEKSEQEKLDVQEEIEQEKLKTQNKDNEENVKMEKEIIDTIEPVVTDSRKDSIKNDDGHEEIKSNNESIIKVQIGKDAENEKEKKSEDLSEKIESVHGPITSAISEQSTEDHSRFGYWTTVTKSSTVETVIEAFNSNTEKIEIADTLEIIADESLIPKKDDFHSAVVKIQACK